MRVTDILINTCGQYFVVECDCSHKLKVRSEEPLIVCPRCGQRVEMDTLRQNILARNGKGGGDDKERSSGSQDQTD